MTEKRSNSTQPQKDNFYQTAGWFYPTLFGVAFFGAILAFSAPLLFPLPQDDDRSIDTIRQLIFFITGGILAMFTLLETHLKNRSPQNKRSSTQTRQARTERRVRYITAIEQITDANHSIRMGGIYTLIGLVDEWLDDDNIDEETRTKEGQVIINNLCSYIRSPFPLAEKIDEYEARKRLEELKKKDSKSLSSEDSWWLDILNERFPDSNDDKKNKQIAADYANIQEEQDVRRTIFVEMGKRSSTFTKNEKGEIIKTISGMWSDFDFDFSRAPIFYPLNKLTIEQGNFASARFYGEADFQDAVFTGDADFRDAEFTGDVYFLCTEFTGDADFRNAEFTGTTKFEDTYFKKSAPKFADDTGPTRFSSQRDQKDYVFSTDQDGKPIDRGIATLDGKSLEIPLGAVLFNTDSGRISEPAKPREDSNTEEEKPAE